MCHMDQKIWDYVVQNQIIDLNDKKWTPGNISMGQKICNQAQTQTQAQVQAQAQDQDQDDLSESQIDPEIIQDLFLISMYPQIHGLRFEKLIKVFKIDTGYVNNQGDNCLIIACRFNPDLEFIKYLIHGVGFDPMRQNKKNENCFLSACAHNQNVEIIRYLVGVIQMDRMHVNKSGDNCLIMGCRTNHSVQVIKYLINDLKIDMNYNYNNATCLQYCCGRNENLDVLKYLMDESSNLIFDDGSDCLMWACEGNKSLDVIKYLVEKGNHSVRRRDDQGTDCLMEACIGSYGIEIIKYLCQRGADVNQVNTLGYNCLMYACSATKMNLEIIEYLVKNIGITKCRNDVTGDDCLIYALRETKDIRIIKYLVENLCTDKNYRNNECHNYLMVACQWNHNLETIKYFIEEVGVNIHEVACGTNCLMLACQFNQNLDVIKYLMGLTSLRETTGDFNCFELSCMSNQSIDVIKYLRSIYGIDWSNDAKYLLNGCGYNNLEIVKYLVEETERIFGKNDKKMIKCMISACQHNTRTQVIDFLINQLSDNVNMDLIKKDISDALIKNGHGEIIEYMIKEHGINPKFKNANGENYLMLLCGKEKEYGEDDEFETIKYLIDVANIDLSDVDNVNYNCLMHACRCARNLRIVKYLIYEKKMDPLMTDNVGNNCLSIACLMNSDQDIVQFLVRDLGIDPDHRNIDNQSCMDLGITNPENQQIVACLINYSKDFNPNKYYKYFTLDILSELIGRIHCHEKVNVLIKNGIEKYGFNRMSQIIHRIKINPYMLNQQNQQIFGLSIPESFRDKMILINGTRCRIPIDLTHSFDQKNQCQDQDQEQNHKIKRQKTKKTNPYISDHTQQTQLLFRHNGTDYWGHKSVVYNSIRMLRKLNKSIQDRDHGQESEDVIVLEGKLPKEIINHYIDLAIHGIQIIDLNIIEPVDFINFLRFIDQYPTIYLSISLIENLIIRYMDQNNIRYNDYLKDMSIRYKLENMYLDIHNKKMKK
jgi:ankyrin repeat protein